MSLTESEMRSLARISAAVRRTDPRLAHMLTRGTVRPSALTVVTIVVGAVLLATICVGIAFHLRLVCAVAWTAVMALSILRGMLSDDGY